jgi:ribosome-binding protein aMBF1 (putative translation factor)
MAYEATPEQTEAMKARIRARWDETGKTYTEEALNETAYRNATTANRNSSSGNWLTESASWIDNQVRNAVFGAKTPTEQAEIEAEKSKNFADMVMKEYGQPIDYGRPQIAMSSEDQTRQGLSAAYASEGVIAARGLGDRQSELDRQNRALGLAEDAALGRAPSVAEIQGRQQLEQAMQSQLAMAARARGGNMSLALRSAGQNAANMGVQGAQNAAMLRAQEMATAREQFASGAAASRTASQNIDKSRVEAMQRGGIAYSADAASQIERALKIKQANLAEENLRREAENAERERRFGRAATGRQMAQGARGAVTSIQQGNKQAPLASAFAQGYMTYATGQNQSPQSTPGASGVNFSQTPKKNPFEE